MAPPSRPRRSKPGSSRPRPRTRTATTAHDSDAPSPQGERLQKLLASAGLGSRRACEELILTGRVEVDRKLVQELGTRVDPVTQEIRVDGEALPKQRPAYFMVHKVQGVLSTANDPSGRPRITDMVPPNLGRLFPVGRLDMNSEGLILLTNDGELANQLTHPRYGIEKTYFVQVAGHIEAETLEQLERGIHLAEGMAKVVGAKIKSHHKNSTLLEMILDEGRNREIRRLLARVGHKVQRLTRVAIGPLKLGDVPPGAYRPLRNDEVEALKQATQHVPIGDRAEKRPAAPASSGSRSLLKQRKKSSKPFAGKRKPESTEHQASAAESMEIKPLVRGKFGASRAGGSKFGGTTRTGDSSKHSGTSTSRGTRPAGKFGGKKPFAGPQLAAPGRTIIGEDDFIPPPAPLRPANTSDQAAGKDAAQSTAYQGKRRFATKGKETFGAKAKAGAGTKTGSSYGTKVKTGFKSKGKAEAAAKGKGPYGTTAKKQTRKGKPSFRKDRSGGKQDS